MLKSLLAASAILLALPASAATFYSLAGAPDPGIGANETIVVDFDNPAAPGYSWTGNLQTATGVNAGVYAAPAGDSTVFGYVSSANIPNWAQLATPDLRSISFYWGSVDDYNQLDVLGEGGVTLLTLTGLTPGLGVPPIDGDQTVNRTNRRVYISAGAGEKITGLRFTSTGVAFEFDDIATSAVPEPATWAMLIAGFGLVGLAARRRRTAVAAS